MQLPDPARPSKTALFVRMERANESLGEGKCVHQIPNQESKGYRPGRKSAAAAGEEGDEGASQGRRAEPHE